MYTLKVHVHDRVRDAVIVHDLYTTQLIAAGVHFTSEQFVQCWGAGKNDVRVFHLSMIIA